MCIRDRNKRGHSVTVFERSDRVGGLLMYGIPNMKLEKWVIERKVEVMKAEGITFITGANVGKNYKGNRIMKEYDRVKMCIRDRQGSMCRKIFTRPSKDMRRFRRAGSAALNALGCAWNMLPDWQRKAVMIILPPPLPSVP